MFLKLFYSITNQQLLVRSAQLYSLTMMCHCLHFLSISLGRMGYVCERDRQNLLHYGSHPCLGVEGVPNRDGEDVYSLRREHRVLSCLCRSSWKQMASCGSPEAGKVFPRLALSLVRGPICRLSTQTPGSPCSQLHTCLLALKGSNSNTFWLGFISGSFSKK